MHQIVRVLQKKAEKYPHHDAVVYLEDGEHETAKLSFGELDQRARVIAACLQAEHLQGNRVLLIYPTGVDFIASLMGCWYAGVIAVPVSCPKIDEFEKHQVLINSIATDADSTAIMTTTHYRAAIEKILDNKVTLIATDEINVNAEHYKPIDITNDTIAYLQYTSGSTSAPKAAVVTHGNLTHSLTATIKAWHYTRKSITLTWAPHTHVYGLVCGLLVPLYHGTRAIIMPPAAFISKPLVWLSAISAYSVTHSGCPNFGYDVCVNHIKEADLARFNLKSWKVAINGGDIVQHQTLMSFVARFRTCGFELSQFCSAYGMSEVTGAIAVSSYGCEPDFFKLQDEVFNRQLVSSGQLLDGLQAIAVDPETGLPVADGQTGEIWLAGDSVVSGYWRRPDETKAVFQAMVPECDTAYFKTGDLGFILNNEIYLTGRLKEVMVVYGKKYYPLDFEITVGKAVARFQINLSQVAFSTEISGKEEIILVQELPEETDQKLWPEIQDVIRHAITRDHGVDIYEVVLTPKGAIPKTGSGKLQRKKAQLLFIDKKFTVLKSEVHAQTSELQGVVRRTQAKFTDLVANVLNIEVQQIDLHAPLSRYAFDSINIIQLTTRLNETYQLELSPAALYEYATLADFCTDLLDKKEMAVLADDNRFYSDETSDIAIIGMSGVFPQAPDVDAFWDNLYQGKDCISEVPSSRWDWRNLTLKWGGFIDGLDHFDAAFFNISPREAELIDPQQRIFLQTVWKTIEDAGYTTSALAAVKTGLFVGVFNHDYAELLQKNEVMDAYLTTGTMHSMIANRISYVLNLRGPSEAIDTACSSSLVAVHQAVHAILQGDCDVAIAGGVNALITPTSFISANKAGMLSEDGRCKTFDKDANGYVRGEGAGAILLKKLSQALRDGDHIYGVIKGTAINHGGHVNSLTAPNPNAQAEVIVSACKRANVSIDSIHYIETHGTGTPLGDPIEINGLKKAFQQLAAEQQISSLPKHYCGLGSVKTHIGHLESAAGIAGIIKILLAMRHELLPANLHLNELNPYIDIKDSPFYLVEQATQWPDGDAVTPRRAGVSSFGFGGANAHVILEERPRQINTPIAAEHPAYLITLSAMTMSALKQRKSDLLNWLNHQHDLTSLMAISYTLNVGRAHFDMRFCVVVESITELKELLSVDDLQSTTKHHELNQLRDQYLAAKIIDWRRIYGDYQGKVALPTYPFAKDSHWIAVKNKFCATVHPLSSDNSRTVFSKQFTGNEFYISEHQVNNESVLPGAVCLEMACAAVNGQVTSLSNIIWKKPIKAAELAESLQVHLFAETDFMSFSITNPAQTIEYVSGAIHHQDNSYSPAPLNIHDLKSVLVNTQTPDEIYTYFKNAGLSYGASFQVIQTLHYDERHLLAELALLTANHEFVIHPCMFDGILHSTQALLKNRDALYLPFSIEQIDIYGKLPNACSVYAHLVSDPEEQHFPVFNIQVSDEEGKVLLVITGFTLCAVSKIETRYYHPVWTEQPLSASLIKTPDSVLILGNNQHTVHSLQTQFDQSIVSCQDLSSLKIESTPDYVLIAFDDLNDKPLPVSGIQTHLEQTYYLVHSIAANLIQLKPKHPVHIICINKAQSMFSQALAGFAKTLNQEQPNISCRFIELHDVSLLAKELGQEEIQVRYDAQNKRYTMRYELLPEQRTESQCALKQSGVYLITGGLGGLGYLFATYLAEQYQAKLVLTGRSTLAERQLGLIAELEKKGASVVYVPADVSCDEDVQALIQRATSHFGAINGVLHAAGLTHDGFIANKTIEEMADVLAPKIHGTCYLHAATSHEQLDFFVLFSSVAAVFGNVGQSDYAYANCFLDEFAHVREQQRALGKCFGQTLSINWPLWEEGGITLAPEYRDWLEQSLGTVSLSTEQGLIAFLHALEQGDAQCVVLPGNQRKLVAALNRNSMVNKAIASKTSINNHNLREHAEILLKGIIAETLKCSPDSLDGTLPFEHYGIDSLMIIQLNQRLEREFAALPKTLFFEYQNLSDLTDYFVAHHANDLNQRAADSAATKVNAVQSLRAAYNSSPRTLRIDSTGSRGQAAGRGELWEKLNDHQTLVMPQKGLNNTVDKSVADIAIIGVSGRYPQAQDLTEFWENLLNGKDCISEIPQDRWDAADYFDANQDSSGTMYSKWGGFLGDVDKFDPLFFNISPREAALMDPQERLFLETAWKTIEDAGYAREHLAGQKVGVYVGVMYGQYQLFGNEHSDQFVPTNSVFSSIANRVSYFFDFHGPSMALDTMCSSSLTAIHLACQSIHDGESQLALAGGVNLSLHPNKYLLLSQGKFLASDGHCRSFGEGGTGYVPGEGVGAVLLKPLHQALADGDSIYAVIKGSQLNHGGKTNGYTVPNPNAQAQLIAEAYQKANIDPAKVSYLEAHGTGTSLGDPIEIAGLNKAFGTDNAQHCAIGSVKSNIGHCESAAGIAALTKVLLQLKHRTLVPSILAETLNSNINWSTTAFKVQQTVGEWQSFDGPRIAGISSFGAGGSNAHLIVAEAPVQLAASSHEKSHYLLTLSAKTEQALRQRVHDLLSWLHKNPDAQLETVAYTLNARRSHFDCRCAMVVYSLGEVMQLLQQIDAPQYPDNLFIQYSAGNKPEQMIMQPLSQTPQYRETLLTLAKYYVEGGNLDWEMVHANESRRIISLPTYPFAKERYWYSDNQQAISALQQAPKQGVLADKISSFLLQQVMQILKITQHKIEPVKSLGDYGMDSVHFIELAKRIAEYYQIEFTPAVFYTHSSVLQISNYMTNQHADAAAQAHHTVAELPIQANRVKSLRIQHNAEEPIAIIGMHALLPQSDDLAAFWQHLIEGHDLVTEVPADRWDWREHADKSNSKWGGFINKVDQFDAGFFNISAREANLMDPQQRLFLETAWKTIEDAGYNPFELPSQKVGVFAGVEFSEYQTLIANQQKEFHGFIATGNSHSMIANRVSYFFDFQGPSEAIDTACSSSLVAIHRAVQSLRYGECELAIAGGVSLMLNPDTVTVTSQLGALSADGRCKTFDQSANGYVKGEGVGSLLLKPLKQAQADGDHIYGIIRASAVNHGGKAQSLTAPNANAQSELLVSAYQQAHINPDTVTYIETHGTGTALGDPVEIEGLKQAFNSLLDSRSHHARIALGSVKTNIGHLEPASGIAGVMKLILSMTHEKIPGILHLNELNPYINLTDTPFYIAKETQAWQRIKDKSGHEIPLRAGVSSFGFGGTNAHLVLEEGLPHQKSHDVALTKPYYLVTLSAKQHESLQQKIVDLHQWLVTHQGTASLAALSFTLNAGRAHFNYRCALVVSSIDELVNALTSLTQQQIPEYCMVNEGQTCTMQGPVFDEIYQTAMNALQHPENHEHYKHKLFILADLYTKHYSIDWQVLHAKEQRKRLGTLPSYPFMKQRYWFDAAVNPVVTQKSLPTVSRVIETDFPSLALAYLRGVFAEKLQTVPEAIEVDETYEVYGVDSVIGLEITNRLEKDFGTLPKTLLYERNRLNDLAKYFIKNYQEQLSALVTDFDEVPVQLALETEVAEPVNTAIKNQPETSRDIAIIGLSGTFPMANTMDEFWHNLSTGRDCVGEVPADRWNYKEYPVLIGGEEKYFPHGGFIPDVDKFDPLFFNISPRDAGFMDPQERLFMQSVWSTLEDAGYTREKLKRQANNSVGVFAGVTYNFYPLFIAEEWQKGNRVPLDIQSFSVANRISYFLDVNGPSFVVDTACSSSLAAIHLACESILRGDCAMAIAGGVNLSLHPSKYHFLGSFNFMSEQGRCTSFAEGGTGYVPSEGVGSVLLKPLADALADNDLIYGVIKGSSMNHGGKTSGYTVPNPNAQADVILQALKTAQIDPRTVSYIEAHGTGTSLGDPIEIRGLQDAFETYTDDRQYCAIGSVKSNIGHLESAAGISQLAKVLLQMRHKQLVPSLHAEQLNPFIDFKNSPFYVQRELSDWQPDNHMPRRAGVSSFGAGGANVHMIIEEYIPKAKPTPQTNGPFLFLLSAFNEERLRAKVQQMQLYVQNNAHTEQREWLSNACYTLQIGREHMAARFAVSVANREELLGALANYPKLNASGAWINYHAQNTVKPISDLSGLSHADLAQHWVNGAKVDWKQWYTQHVPQLISLPTYAFTKRRCWIPTKEVEAPVQLAPVLAVEDTETFDCQEWLYTTQWEKNPQKTISGSKVSEGKWLIFSADKSDAALHEELSPDACIYCYSGEQFTQFDKQTYSINPAHKADYEALFHSVNSEHGLHLKGVIYLGTAQDADPSLVLLHLFKAMSQHSWQHQLTFCLASQSAQQVNSSDVLNIWQHHLWSMTRIFAAEQASYQVLLLDLDAKQSPKHHAKSIVRELSQVQANQNHIAYRDQERYTLRFLPQETPQEIQPWIAPIAALITGGLGALGYEVAEFLIAQGTRFILLTGATELSLHTPEKNAWLQQLESKGAQVKYAAVDVANQEQMHAVITEAEKAWQRDIDGVFHLAGITTDNVPIADMDEALWNQVLNVKIKGALVLHELFSQAKLSCFVLFSSIAAVPHFGMSGLSAYAVANEFISGLACYRRSLQLPASSINWVAWSEKGMSHRHNHDAFLDAVGMASLSIKDGMTLLHHLLKLNPAEITVCKIQWKKFLQINATAKQLDFFSHFVAEYASTSKTQLVSTWTQEQIAELVPTLFAKVLGLELDELDEEIAFQQYGLDSITGIGYTEELSKHFPDVVSPMDLYRYPTLKQLINYIIQGVCEPISDPIFDVRAIIDLDHLDAAQLNELLESELHELEQIYD